MENTEMGRDTGEPDDVYAQRERASSCHCPRYPRSRLHAVAPSIEPNRPFSHPPMHVLTVANFGSSTSNWMIRRDTNSLRSPHKLCLCDFHHASDEFAHNFEE